MTDNTQPTSPSADGDAARHPLITVATVTYNAGRTLERTLRSVASQDYPAVEHVIVDGCSSDNTLALVQRYVERNTAEPHGHAIRLLREPDEGLYDAMNKALSLATGDYIVFLNAGDKLHSSSTLSQVAALSQWRPNDASNPGIIYGETDIVDDEGRFLRHRRLAAPDRLTWRSFLQGMLVCHQSFYVRTDLARHEPYDRRYRFSADFDWCIRLMRKAEKRRAPIVNARLVLTDYLSEGLTTAHHRASLLERLRIMGRRYGWCRAAAVHLWFVVRAVVRK